MEAQKDQMAVRDRAWKTTQQAHKLMADRNVVIIHTGAPGQKGVAPRWWGRGSSGQVWVIDDLKINR